MTLLERQEAQKSSAAVQNSRVMLECRRHKIDTPVNRYDSVLAQRLVH
jgi:hypothetical protein